MTGRRSIFYFATLATVTAILALGWQSDSGAIANAEAGSSEPLLVGLTPDKFRLLSGAHLGLNSDRLGFALLQLVSDESSSPDAMASKRQRIMQIVRLKPNAESIYMLACYHLALEDDHADDCDAIAIAGLDVFPESSSIAMMAGYVDAFILRDEAAARAMFERAARMPNAPLLATEMLAYLGDLSFWDSPAFSGTISWADQTPGGELFKEFLQDSRDELQDERDSETEPSTEEDETESTDDAESGANSEAGARHAE